MSSGKPAEFDTALIQIDKAEITSIEIYPHSGPSYVIHKMDPNWIVSNGNVSVQAEANRLYSVLNQIDTIKTFRKVADGPSEWENYGLRENQASRIKIYANNKVLEDFFIGRTDFDTKLNKSIAYVRIAGQNEIFAVNGFLPFQLEKHFNEYRNSNLFSNDVNYAIPDQIIYQSLDTLIHLDLNQNMGFSVDSLKFSNYWQQLLASKGRLFADDFDELSAEKYFHQRLTLSYNGSADSILLSCYRDSTRHIPFLIHSTHNSRSFFKSDSTGLYQSIFEEFINLIVNN